MGRIVKTVLFAILFITISAGSGLHSFAENGERVYLGAGNTKKGEKGSVLWEAFTVHAGGTVFDMAGINEGCYFEAKYTGAEGGVYLELISYSGGSESAVVWPAQTYTDEQGRMTAVFTYDTIASIYGTDFQLVDILRVCTGANQETSLLDISYVPGSSGEVHPENGKWDRSMEGIAFVGDSIVQNALTYYGDWNGILGRTDCVNYGITNQTTYEIVRRLDDVLLGNYEKIVLICGINDLGQSREYQGTIDNYYAMLDKITEVLPNAGICVMSVLPTSSEYLSQDTKRVEALNEKLKELVQEYDHAVYVDCYSEFVTTQGYCNPDYVSDGLHPNDMGYGVIAEILNPYLDADLSVMGQPSANEVSFNESLSQNEEPSKNETPSVSVSEPPVPPAAAVPKTVAETEEEESLRGILLPAAVCMAAASAIIAVLRKKH